ncbi:hypothetical protein [uncultured Ellagibacter sp.]|nr:hypothetical protein [uncultured Ellagibacter sp.]
MTVKAENQSAMAHPRAMAPAKPRETTSPRVLSHTLLARFAFRNPPRSRD